MCAHSHKHDVNAHVDVRIQSKASSLGFKDTISHLTKSFPIEPSWMTRKLKEFTGLYLLSVRIENHMPAI